MAKVKVTTSYCRGGGHDIMAGTILTVGVDITAEEAALKIKQGYVAPVPEGKALGTLKTWAQVKAETKAAMKAEAKAKP